MITPDITHILQEINRKLVLLAIYANEEKAIELIDDIRDNDIPAIIKLLNER